MKNKLISQINAIDGKLFIELPVSVIQELSVTAGDNIEFGMGKDVCLWKSLNTDIPENVFKCVLETFKTDNAAFQWLNTKRAIFEGKSAMELISTPEGKEKVFDILYKIKTGDIS